MFYREDKHGQVLQEGINEAGAMSSWIAAGTSYSNHGVPTIPFYIYYSMFGFQRIGDLAWAAGDSRTRGFLLGGTAGRTTLNGEGLQHEDGHSHLLSATIPNCVSYDPTYGYELAVIIREGLRRMIGRAGGRLLLPHADERELPAPGDARGRARRASCAGCTCCSRAPRATPQVQLLGSGTILREVLAAADLLRDDFGVDGRRLERHELHRAAARGHGGRALEHRCIPDEEPRATWVESRWRSPTGPVIAATDYMRSFADQIRPWVHAPYRVLGTDGFGRSDYRKTLRSFFEVDRHHVALAALTELAEDGRGRRGRAQARRSSPTASTPSGPRRGGCEGGAMAGDRAGPRPGHRGLRRRTGDRGARGGRRHRRAPRIRW